MLQGKQLYLQVLLLLRWMLSTAKAGTAATAGGIVTTAPHLLCHERQKGQPQHQEARRVPAINIQMGISRTTARTGHCMHVYGCLLSCSCQGSVAVCLQCLVLQLWKLLSSQCTKTNSPAASTSLQASQLMNLRLLLLTACMTAAAAWSESGRSCLLLPAACAHSHLGVSCSMRMSVAAMICPIMCRQVLAGLGDPTSREAS